MCVGAQEVNNINEITSIIAKETAVILRFIISPQNPNNFNNIIIFFLIYFNTAVDKTPTSYYNNYALGAG